MLTNKPDEGISGKGPYASSFTRKTFFEETTVTGKPTEYRKNGLKRKRKEKQEEKDDAVPQRLVPSGAGLLGDLCTYFPPRSQPMRSASLFIINAHFYKNFSSVFFVCFHCIYILYPSLSIYLFICRSPTAPEIPICTNGHPKQQQHCAQKSPMKEDGLMCASDRRLPVCPVV